MRFRDAVVVLLPLCLIAAGLVAASPDRSDIRGGKAASRPLDYETARVTFASGSVDSWQEEAGWSALRPGQGVAAGDTIRTGAGGRAELRTQDGRILRIERETVLVLTGSREGQEVRLAKGHLRRGRVWLQAPQGAGLTLASPMGEAKAEGDVLSLAVSATGPDSLSVFEGSVPLQLGTSRHTVGAGEGHEAGPWGGRRFALPEGDDWRDGWLTLRKPGGAPVAPKKAGSPPQRRRLTRTLQDLNPDVYLGVELELAGRQGQGGFRPSEARIRRIRVRASRWDALEPGRRVELLNQTFAALKARYPNITHSVVLEFDDERPDLSLRYASDLRG